MSGGARVAAVFAVSAESAGRAVRYLHAQIPHVPVWLYCRQPVEPEVAALCAQVIEPRRTAGLPHRPALVVVTWTGSGGGWLLKLAPFLIPPFRVLVMNEHGGFFNGKPLPVLRHVRRRAADALHSGWNRFRDLRRGAAFWFFALLAQRFAFLSRFAFRKGHGGEPLDLGTPPSAGQGVVRFRYGHRQWNRAELLRLLRESGARWVLFLESGAEDQLPWVDDPRTFAVSRQRDFRDWKPGLFAMAPFRRLQPEEISPVLAPVSDAVLVDRARLLALGIPETIVPGTAWLLLFWKAAAAGWRSYSIGGNRPLDEAPDWPYEEAEFVTRVLAAPDLRRLGPREPGLVRGSIAHAPSCALPFREGKPRVLVVSPYLPYPLSHGGAVRIYSLCRALSDRVDFILACFRERDDTADYRRLHEVFREVYVVDVDEKASRDESLPRQVRGHVSSSMQALIGRLCREKAVDLLQVEFTHLAHFRDAASGVPAILVEHDLTFTLYRQFALQEGKRRAREEFERWLAFERRWLRSYDCVWTMSETDRTQALEQGSPPGRTFVVANGVDTGRFTPQPEAGAGEILYVGSFRHKPNVLGFERLRNEIMPRVWLRAPGARLRVVAGPDPEKYWKGEPDSRIQLHAFVEDLRPLYARAAAVAVPLLVSAGTNIKVMEAMACGKAVVSTPVGCQGLDLEDGRDLLVRADPEAFADALCGLLADPERRACIGAQARAAAEQRFGWQQIAARAWASYRILLGTDESVADA